MQINLRIIRYMSEKFKSWLLNDQIFYGVTVILVSIISFGLGQASVTENTPEENKNRIDIIEPKPTKPPKNFINEESSQTAQINKVDEKSTVKPVNFVASKNGKRYYLPECGGVKRIKPENIVTFAKEESARAAGYTKALNCPGL